MLSLVRDHSKRLGLGFLIINIFVLIAYFGNNLRPLINLKAELWDPPTIMPEIKPIGTDFREGYYYPAKVVLEGKDPYIDYNLIYPPFSAVFSIPFRLGNVDQAYLAQVGLLYILNAATIWISLMIAVEVFGKGYNLPGNSSQLIAYGLFPALAFLGFTSYGFYFSVERGNSDIYAQFLVILAFWFLVTKPKSMWLPVLLVSMATHLKLYPAIMFIPILWKFRWQSILPIIITNVALSLVLGPERAWEYIQRIVVYFQNPFLFPANHSAASFAHMVNGYLVEHEGVFVPSILFYLLPLFIWGIGVFILWRRKYSPTNLLLFFILSVPLMNLIPSTSYDYKLVILMSPLAIVLYFLLINFSQRGKLIELLEIIGLMFLMLFITRSYYLMPPILTNKYPFVLAMQSIFLLVILVSPGNKPVNLDAQPGTVPYPISNQTT